MVQQSISYFTAFRWTCVLICVAAIAFFPPQRRAGNWTGQSGLPVELPTAVAHRIDRIEFGYIPSFRWVGSVGCVVSISAISGLGPYEYTSYRWVIDWPWVIALAIIGMLIIAIWGFWRLVRSIPP